MCLTGSGGRFSLVGVASKPTVTTIRFPKKRWHTFTNRCRHVFFCSAGREPGDLALVEHSGGRTPGAEQWLFGHMTKVFSGLINVKLKGWAGFLHGEITLQRVMGKPWLDLLWLKWNAVDSLYSTSSYTIEPVNMFKNNYCIWIFYINMHFLSFFLYIGFLIIYFINYFRNYLQGLYIQKNKLQFHFTNFF